MLCEDSLPYQEQAVSPGEWVRAAREARGLSQRELAKALDVSQGVVSQWENNITRPKLSNMVMLSQVLDHPLTGMVGPDLAYPGELVEDVDELSLLYMFRNVAPETRLFLASLCRGAVSKGNVVALPAGPVTKVR